MHGVKRLGAEKRAQMRREDEEKARHYHGLSKAAMALRAQRVYDEDSLAVCERVLSINPEMTTLWNFRREILQHLFNLSPGGPNEDNIIRETQICQVSVFVLKVDAKTLPSPLRLQMSENIFQNSVEQKG